MGTSQEIISIHKSHDPNEYIYTIKTKTTESYNKEDEDYFYSVLYCFYPLATLKKDSIIESSVENIWEYNINKKWTIISYGNDKRHG